MYRLFIYLLLTVFILSCESGSDNLGSNVSSENENSISVKDIQVVDTNNLKKQTNKISLFKGYLNKKYSYDLKSDAKLVGEAYYIYSNNLPDGLELDESTGIISGYPKETGDFKLDIAVKQEEEELVIRPAVVSIDDNILFYKDVRSFIDLSKTSNSTVIAHDGVINLASSPAKDFFQFYGNGVSSIRVCQEGYLKLDGNGCSFTSDFENNKIIAPFADPELVLGADSHIYYQVRGIQPRRMLIVQFENMHRTTDASASQNFEVIIYEDSSRVSFLYGLSYSNTNNTQKHLGTNAIIGLFSTDKDYLISPEVANTNPKPSIFNGTIITLKAPDSNVTQYRKTLDSNIVTDFVDISRYLEETDDCTSDSQCRLSDKCFDGKCASNLLTIPLMYDNARKVDLPFYFNFYGNSFNEVKVHENGYLFFDDEIYSFYSQAPYKSAAKPVNQMGLNYVIAGLFSNIDLKSVRGGNILYNVVGSSPNRKAIFLYDKVRILDPDDDTTHICTFEIALHETSNIIEFIYGTNNGTGFCSGIASSVGLKKDSSDYISIVSNNPVLKQGKSIVFVPDDNLANSYTWVGVGNEFKNSNATDGSNGKFTKVPFQWNLIDDSPATEFVRYDQTIVSNQWIDTTAGNHIYLGDVDLQPLPNFNNKSFNFYGLPRTQFYVQSKGGITTTNNSIMNWDEEPTDINTYTTTPIRPDEGIFPYWNDLNPPDGEVRYLYTTKSSEDVVVVEWNSLPRWYVKNNGQWYLTGNYTFQIQMYTNGQKYMCYKTMDNGSSSKNTTYLSGIRHSKGDAIQNNESLSGLASTGNCIAYTPVYRYPANHISAIRSTVSSADAGEQNVPLGFTYNFMGNSFDNITIGSNGLARLENIIAPNIPANISGTNEKLSSTLAYDNSLALFWDDFDPRSNTTAGSGVFYATTGTAPNRTFILSYNAVPHGSSTDSRISAQLILQEGRSNIQYCYGDLAGSYSLGDSATIGIRKNISDYTTLLFEEGILQSNTCYNWTPPTPGFVEARSLFTEETNSDFIDIPVEHTAFGLGEYLEELYGSGGVLKPYSIYDLSSQNYTFSFKGREYKQLFVDAKGAVSFGNDNDAAIVTAPMWGDVFYQTDITNKSHISLQTPYENVENDFMWIANSGGNSLSKINTHDGTVSGPYSVGSSPSRTAVGFDGAVWVGNRNSHNVTKLDRDGNLICTVNLINNCSPRGVALDKDENVWVGCGNWRGSSPDGWVYKIRDNHSETGNRCEILDIRGAGDNSDPNIPENLAFKSHVNYGHYGFAVDKHGILWSSPGTHDNTHSYFLRIDTNKRSTEAGFYKRFRGDSNNSHAVGTTWESREGVVGGKDGTPFQYYGIAVDLNGDLWLGNWGATSKTRAITKAHYDEVNDKLIFEIFPSYQSKSVSNARGVAIDANGFIYVAYSGTHNVGKFASDGTAVDLFYLNSNNGPEGANYCYAPTGIGVDGDGDVWANCLDSSKSEELDVNTGQELKSLPTGNSPYCYSDNTGFNLRNIVTDVKPAKYYAGITTFEAFPNEAACANNDPDAYRSRKLIVEWRDVRIKTDTNHGYTEASYEMIFDNGYRYDCNDLSLVKSIHPVSIKFLYGAMQGNRYSQKTGGQSIITLKSLYSDYNHVFGDQDSGTVNTGSKLVITSER